MVRTLKRQFSLIAGAVVLTAGMSLATADAFAAASSAAAAGATGTAGGATGTGGAAGAGNGSGATSGGGGQPHCAAGCNTPRMHRLVYERPHRHSACSVIEPAFDRLGNYVGETVVQSCFIDE
jgi:hypothetical protein